MKAKLNLCEFCFVLRVWNSLSVFRLSLQCPRYMELLVAREFHFCQSFPVSLAVNVSPLFITILSAVCLHVTLSHPMLFSPCRVQTEAVYGKDLVWNSCSRKVVLTMWLFLLLQGWCSHGSAQTLHPCGNGSSPHGA